MPDDDPLPRIPAEVYRPGHHIYEELIARDWTLADLSAITHIKRDRLREIVAGMVPIGPEYAESLAMAFGTSAEVWLRLDKAYRKGGTVIYIVIRRWWDVAQVEHTDIMKCFRSREQAEALAAELDEGSDLRSNKHSVEEHKVEEL